MSQARVTDFFATRKRNLHQQDQVLLAKQKRTHSLLEKDSCSSPAPAVEPAMVTRSTRTTRSKAAKEEQEAREQPAPLKENPAPAAEIQEPVAEKAPKKTRGSKKKELEELKAKINNFDEKLKIYKRSTRGQKNLEPEEEEKEATPPPPPAEEPEAKEKKTPVEKKQLKADLRQKIAAFNQNLLVAQQKQQAAAAEAKKAEELAPAASVAEKDQPAYIKYKDLASPDLDPTCTLTLPKTYSMLLNAFKACDSIVKYFHTTQAVCTFLRLKLGVQNLLKSKFEKQHLGQIRTIYPQAYVYSVEKLFVDFKNDYHLTVAMNNDEVPASADGKKEFNSLVLLQRYTYFKSQLFAIVKDLHQAFLKSMNITLEAKDIKRWHPAFNMDEIKPIEAAELPEPKHEPAATGKDLMSIAGSVYNQRIKDAITGLVSETNAKLAEKKLEAEKAAAAQNTTELIVEFEEPPTKATVLPAAAEVAAKPAAEPASDDYLAKLKEKKDKAYNDILERVKAKEKAKAIESMIINSDREKQLAKYQNMGEATRLLSFFFDSEKKSIVDLNKACQVLADNLSSRLNALECRELIDEMTKDALFVASQPPAGAASWLTVVKVRLQMYLKMDKSFDVIVLREKVAAKIEEIKKTN